MQRLIFSTPAEQNHFRTDGDSGVSVTSSNFNAQFPASNMLTYDPTEVAQTNTGTGTVTFTVDLGRNREFQLISLLHTTTDYRTEIKLEVSANNTTWTVAQAQRPFWPNLATRPAVYSGSETLDPRKNSIDRMPSLFIFPTTQNQRYIRVTITTPPSNFTIGRFFVGPVFEPKFSLQYGSAVEFSDSGTRVRTQKGSVVLDPGRRIVSASVKLNFLTKDEMEGFIYDLNYWRGNTREILCVLDADNLANVHRSMVYGTITEGRRITADSFDAYSQTLVIESL